MLTDRQDAQILVAIVEKLVRAFGSFALGEEVTGTHAVHLLADHEDTCSTEYEKALLFLVVPMKLCRALAGTNKIDVDAYATQTRVLTEATRKPERLAARLVLAFAGGCIFGACEPLRSPVAALAQALGGASVNRRDSPFAGGQGFCLDPTAGSHCCGDLDTDSFPLALAIDK